MHYPTLWEIPERITFGSGGKAQGMYTPWNRSIVVFPTRACDAESLYVDTLVHELTHAQQHREGKPFCETEAYAAGYKAYQKHLRHQQLVIALNRALQNF